MAHGAAGRSTGEAGIPAKISREEGEGTDSGPSRSARRGRKGDARVGGATDARGPVGRRCGTEAANACGRRGLRALARAGPRAAEAGLGRRERARLREWAARVCLGRAGKRVRGRRVGPVWAVAGFWAWFFSSFFLLSFPNYTQTKLNSNSNLNSTLALNQIKEMPQHDATTKN